MRLLFLLLVFANLALFAWTRWLAPGEDAAISSPALEVPRILLVGEAAPAGAAVADDGGAAAAAVAAASADATASAKGGSVVPPLTDPAAAAIDATRCVSVGPITDLEAAARVNATLVELGYQPRQRPAEGRVPDGWVVLVGGLADAAEQASVERRLKRGGLTDAASLPAGAAPFAVSAGLFSERRRAERRAEAVGKIGLTPRIEPRLKAGTVYFIDIDLHDVADAGPLQEMQLGNAGLPIEPCPAPPAGDRGQGDRG
jgi:hypothetical protein